MSIFDIVIILACLAGGYWIVSSVMGPGVDITRREPPGDKARDAAPAPKPVANARQADWQQLLDVPGSASRAEIEAAYRRQLEKALARGDADQQEKLRRARDTALEQTRREALGG